MPFKDWIGKTPTELANITDEVTPADAAYMRDNVSSQVADIIAHLERPGAFRRAIFTDGFDAGAGGDPVNWKILSGPGNWTEDAGVLGYAPTLPSAPWQTISRLDQPIFNAQSHELVFQVEVTAFTHGNGAVRLDFRKLSPSNFYYLLLDEDGVHLRKVVEGADLPFDAYTLADAEGLNDALVLDVGPLDFVVAVAFDTWTVTVNGIQTHAATDDGWFDRGGVGISGRDINFSGDNYVLTNLIDGG